MEEDNKQYTFVEFVAAIESDDFDNITENALKWANSFINEFPNIMKTEYHFGDCTGHAITCAICIYENLLLDYKEYIFNEINWRKSKL